MNSRITEVDADVEQTANCLKSIAHPIRLAIIKALQKEPLCVSDIENSVGSTQSNVSQHLAILRKNNIVKTKRDKNQIYYYVDNWRIFKLLALATEIFCRE
jgi:DNA-binding transcriptional ArsR family regulator